MKQEMTPEREAEILNGLLTYKHILNEVDGEEVNNMSHKGRRIFYINSRDIIPRLEYFKTVVDLTSYTPPPEEDEHEDKAK